MFDFKSLIVVMMVCLVLAQPIAEAQLSVTNEPLNVTQNATHSAVYLNEYNTREKNTPIPRINIREPNIVKPYTAEYGLIELEKDAVYYSGDAPLTLKLAAQFDSPSGMDIEKYNWTVYCEDFHDSGKIITYYYFDEPVINPSFEKPGKCTIELMVTDQMGIESDKPASITIYVGPMLQFVSGDPLYQDNPMKLVLHKKLGDRLDLSLKVNFIPEIIPNCALKNEEGGYEQIVDIYVVLYIPGSLVPILLGEDMPEESVIMWFSEMTHAEIPRLGLVPIIDMEHPFIPFRTAIDLQQHHFGLMKTPIEDEAWLGTHSFYIAAGLFREQMKFFDNNSMSMELPVCIDLANKHVVIMNEIEVHIEE